MEKDNMSFRKAFLLMIPVIAFLALYTAINLMLGLKEVWIGFLLLWYWGEKNASLEALLKTIFPGAVIGVAVAYILHTLPDLIGTSGLIISLIIVLFIVMCTFAGRFKMYVNGATFLYLTVISIPMIAEKANYFEYLMVIVVGCVYLGLSSWLMKLISKPKNDKIESLDS
ncbi:hypothetical protein [Oceanirhabdus seepicola]|uniref:DUF1097 domain-containing protein n=1 Tax=Oceanirhabdus seepicola TaxID=2828781 RepID=A0A9J6P647_9CLOT|nr:hypothetical protein [Oceanirhabdus seepicola]MCM1991732.1 hypothetical protein [Oceanirhabdus seepicola]